MSALPFTITEDEDELHIDPAATGIVIFMTVADDESASGYTAASMYLDREQAADLSAVIAQWLRETA